MKRAAAPGMAFITLGVVFIAVGSSGQRAFLAVGAAFLVIGVVFLASKRPAGDSK